ncbi:MAG: L-histidine N(alpha)-methyltransferase, partial [Pseudomonadota bacterium]
MTLSSAATVDIALPTSDFLDDILAGLAQPQKTLPCVWLYDAHGSELFEQITQLPEYYLTRTETQILTDIADELATQIGQNAQLIEYGAGASVKTRILLNSISNLNAYIPIDVSEDFLLQTADQLRRDYPDLSVRPVVSDFLSVPDLPAHSGPRIGFFPGSTIGNLSDDDIHRFLSNARKALGPDALFILGYDRVKPLSTLIPAYDDAQGVTAAFNLNLLRRINRELGGTFDLQAFRHEARWNAEDSRIEMHLVSQKAQSVRIGSTLVNFEQSETIHTENSRKFTPERMESLCRAAGWQMTRTY